MPGGDELLMSLLGQEELTIYNTDLYLISMGWAVEFYDMPSQHEVKKIKKRGKCGFLPG